MHVVPVLLAILVGLLFAVLAWGFLRVQSHRPGVALMGVRDDVLISLLVLAAFALGIFLAYILIVVS
jgi:hypothetical protein